MFRVGQRVICVNSKPLPGFDTWHSDDTPPRVGEVYTVRRSFIDDDGNLVLWLDEIRRGVSARHEWGEDVGYGAFRFRPIVERKRKTSIAIFKRLLTPTDKVSA